MSKRAFIIQAKKVLEETEKQKLFNYLRTREARPADRHRLLLICDILLNTGLRVEELCNLRVQDTPVVLGSYAIDVYRGKGDKDRTVPISERLAKAICDYYHNIRGLTMPRFHQRTDYSKPMFYNNNRRPYTRNAIYKVLRRAGAASGIRKRLHPHMFRHTFATDALIHGIDIYMVQQLLGHADIRMTMAYQHFFSARLKDLGEKIDQCF